MILRCNNFTLDLGKKTHVMGILNVTPDSFSDGGVHFDTAGAVDHALRMADEGADIVDIGGESTRPGSDPVPVDEEISRTLPIIEALAGRLSVPISIDTCKSSVASRAIGAGASIVNDISGLRFDPAMAAVVARNRVPVVVMHMQGTPKNMQENPTYHDLIPDIISGLRESIRMAANAGISEEMVIIDPGIGFGKTFDHNLEIINRLDRFSTLGRPILIGPSRKAFIGKILGDAQPSDRLEGTAAAVAVSILRGANIVRVHDVKEMVRVARVADAIKRERVA